MVIEADFGGGCCTRNSLPPAASVPRMKDVPGDQMWWNPEPPGRGDEELRESLHAMNLQEPEAEDKRRGWQRKNTWLTC